MTYEITLVLNEKGQAVVGAATRRFTVNFADMPTTEDINKFVKDNFPMPDGYSEIQTTRSFRDINVGDIVAVYSQNKCSLGEVTYKIDSGYGHEIRVRTIDDPCDMYDRRFGFDGKEIGGSRKNKSYIIYATPAQIAEYKACKDRDTIETTITSMLFEYWSLEQLGIEAGQLNMRSNITMDQLKRIFDILNESVQ